MCQNGKRIGVELVSQDTDVHNYVFPNCIHSTVSIKTSLKKNVLLNRIIIANIFCHGTAFYLIIKPYVKNNSNCSSKNAVQLLCYTLPGFNNPLPNVYWFLEKRTC